MHKITIIKSENPTRVCKEYTKDSSGKIIKSVVANVTKGIAVSKDANTAQEFVKWLNLVTSRDDLVLCAGVWDGDPGEKFEVLPEHELAKILGSEIGKVAGGVTLHDGRLISSRLKRGIQPSSWVLLDADNPVGIPDEWAKMTIAERLNLWDQLLPGISECERIELRGSSARVVNGSGSHKATHAWIRVSDPQKIALMKAYLSVEMVIKGVSFQYKKHSRIDPNKVVGIESRSVFDLAVFDTGRLVFTAKPTVLIDGYTVDDAGITIINEGAGPLNIDWITRPIESLHKYREITGINMNVSISDDGYLSVHNSGQLTLETEIVSKGVIKSLADWVNQIKPGEKLRCESPFRESASEAAFIKLGDDGIPFVHDVGNGTTYQLKKTVSLELTSQGKQEVVEWITDGKGRIEANQDNLFKLLDQYDLSYDDFRAAYMITVDGKVRNLKETDYTLIQYQAEKLGFKRLSTAMVRENVIFTAQSNVFDSAIDWGKSLVWDGVPRCQNLLSTYFGAEDSDYTQSASLYITTAMGGRLMSPGCKADAAIVLVGKQGVGKSMGVQALAPVESSYIEIDMSARDADQSRQLRGRLIGELSELKGIKSKDAESIKAWMSKTHEDWIPKYQEFSQSFPRRLTFWGTTNDTQFLSDTTGNRRFIPITVGNTDIDAIKRDRDQIWAEAIGLYLLIGVSWQGVQKNLFEVQKQYFDEDPMMDDVREYLALNNALEKVVSKELWTAIYPNKEFGQIESKRLKRAMEYLGHKKLVFKKDKKSVNGYIIGL
jgi:hypothetical protein